MSRTQGTKSSQQHKLNKTNHINDDDPGEIDDENPGDLLRWYISTSIRRPEASKLTNSSNRLSSRGLQFEPTFPISLPLRSFRQGVVNSGPSRRYGYFGTDCVRNNGIYMPSGLNTDSQLSRIAALFIRYLVVVSNLVHTGTNCDCCKTYSELRRSEFGSPKCRLWYMVTSNNGISTVENTLSSQLLPIGIYERTLRSRVGDRDLLLPAAVIHNDNNPRNHAGIAQSETHPD